MAKNWKSSDKTDDVRAAHASSYGGFELYDADKLAKIRGAIGILISVSEFKTFHIRWNYLMHNCVYIFCGIESWSENFERRLQLDTN